MKNKKIKIMKQKTKIIHKNKNKMMIKMRKFQTKIIKNLNKDLLINMIKN